MRLRYLISTFVVVYAIALAFVLLFGQGALGNVVAGLIAWVAIVATWYAWGVLSARNPHKRKQLFQRALIVSLILVAMGLVHVIGAYASSQQVEYVVWAFTPTVLLLVAIPVIYLSFTKSRYRLHH